jgi:hypothetical protein
VSRPRKPKGDALDRSIAALGRLGKTKAGRDIIRDHREALLACLCEAVGKP